MSERRFALLIANDEYDDPRLSRLKAPPHDATDLERVLQDPAIGGFAGVKTLINQQAQTIRDEIARFFTGKERDDLLMVYFSGHGVLDKDDRSLYLAVKDTQTDLLSSRGIEAHAVTRQMDKSQVRRIVLIFDCCYSGAFERTKGLSVGTTLDIGQSFEGSGFGRVVLTASNAVQVAFDGDQVTGDFEQSLFTHYLVEGLETGAAGGTSEWITVDALYAYVHRQVTRTGRQTPQKWAYKQEGEIIIARNPHPATALQPAAVVLGRHFICYSPLDGEAAALRLYDALTQGAPALPAWLDRRDVQQPGSAWDTQVEEALRGCASLLLVVTPDSASEHCDCAREWRRALQYKKPIVPLLFHAGVSAPFYLANRQAVDFCAFEPALATLREHLAWLATPAGALQQLKDRQADAQRDLRGADAAQQVRIRAEIDLLRQQIAAQQQVVDHPEQAAQRVEESIARGLEREQQPEKPAAGVPRSKFINPPPVVPPAYFQDRTVELALLGTFLKDESCRMVTVMGRAGIGKTALACLLLKALERGHLPDLSAPGGDGEPLEVDGIVYLGATGTHTVSMPNLYADLCKLLPDQAARELDALYRNPQASTTAKMQALLAAFPRGRLVVLLDNFENVMEPETQNVRDAELDEALRALLGAPHHAVKVILTTRIAPRDLALVEPGRQARLELDTGLASPYAENVLRAMDADGTVRLKGAPDELLAEARERTRGYPRALEALFAILSADRHTTLREVLERAKALLPENVVEVLVGEAFSRLDPAARQVMQALALYDRPVTPAALDYLLQPYLPGVDGAPVLNRLVAMHLARKEGGRYFLHPVDRAYAFEQIPVGEEIALLHRGAEYFRQARKPRAEWKRLEDLAPQLAEFDLRCAGGEYDTAAQVLLEIDFDYLLLWGHCRLMAGLHERLQGKLSDLWLKQASVGRLGSAYAYLGQTQKGIACQEQALAVARQMQNRGNEGVCLGNLGNRYAELGQTTRAIEYHEQALAIAREIGDRAGEGRHLGNLGSCYAALEQTTRAIEYYEQALAIACEIGDRRGEGADLGNLGNRYAALGQTARAIEYYEQALAIDREIADRRGEGADLGNLGSSYAALGQTARAIEYYEQALVIAREIGDRRGEGADLGNLGNRYAELGQTARAIEYYEHALVIDHEIGNRRGEGIYLDNLAEVLVDEGRYSEAVQRALESVEIGEEISSPDLGSFNNGCLALAHLCAGDLPAARAAAEAARQYDVPENNHYALALLGIIALRQGDGAAAQEASAAAVAQADTLLAHTPQYYAALDSRGLALCGLALCEARTRNQVSGRNLVSEATAAYRAARAINRDAGVVNRVLRLFDALAAADTAGVLAGVRDAANGRADG